MIKHINLRIFTAVTLLFTLFMFSAVPFLFTLFDVFLRSKNVLVIYLMFNENGNLSKDFEVIFIVLKVIIYHLSFTVKLPLKYNKVRKKSQLLND